MYCVYCNQTIYGNRSGICKTCKNDNCITIFKQDAIKHFHLTNDDLEDSRLFKLDYKRYNIQRTLYLRIQIESIAYFLTKCLKKDHPKKIAYLSHKLYYTDKKIKINSINPFVKIIPVEINNDILMLLEKYDIQSTISIRNYVTELIHKYYHPDDYGFWTSVYIANEIYKNLTIKIEISNACNPYSIPYLNNNIFTNE